jgi:hypothetical protein
MAATAGRLQCRLVLVAFTALLCGLGSRPVSAQVVTKPDADPKWTAEFHGSLVRSPTPTGGAAGQFPAGTTFRTETGFPSRANPSWYFGDGAALFNQVNAQFASRFTIRFPQLVPLDGVLTGASVGRQGGGGWGFRVARTVTSRFGVEFSVDRGNETRQLTASARSAIDAARASFESAFSGLLATIPQTGLRVTSTAEIGEASARHTAITGALTIALTRHGRLATHALAGAGRAVTRQDPIEARLRGNYQFRFFDTFAVNETDAVTIHFTDRESTMVGVFGGGITSDFGERHGLRADVRVFAGTSGAVTLVDAASSSQRVVPFVALPSNTNPSIQFSTTTTDRSSLTGSSTGLRTFNGSGLDMRVAISVGYYIRF